MRHLKPIFEDSTKEKMYVAKEKMYVANDKLMLYIERGLYAYAQKLLREDPDIDLSNDTYELIIRCLQIFKYTQVEDEENLLKALLNHRSVNKIEVAQRYLKMQKSYEDNPVSEFAPVYRKIKLTIRYLKRLDPDFKNIFDLHENFDLLD